MIRTTLRALSWTIVLAAGAEGCKPRTDAPAPGPGASGTATAATDPSRATASRATPAQGTPRAGVPAERAAKSDSSVSAGTCKALDQGKRVALGSRTTDPVALRARDGFVYWLGFQRAMAKVELVRFGRDGGKPTELGSYTGLGEPRGFALGKSAALFTMKQTLIAIPLAGGEASKLASDFSLLVAASDTHAYGVRCDKKAGSDQLVRVKLDGGEVEVAASWPRAKGSTVCDYKGLALDEQSAFVADWGNRRLLSVSLADGSSRDLVKGQAWLSQLALEKDSVVFNSGGGMFRVPKAGGTPKRLSDLGSAPFSSFAWDPSAIYVLQTEAYSMRDFIAKLPSEGGKAQDLEGLAVPDVVEGSGASNLTVDDECLYFTQRRKGYVEVMARPK
jgi:hypothetical protein